VLRFRAEVRDISLTKKSRPAVGPKQAHVQRVAGGGGARRDKAALG
jgi:hypothetical protein